MWRGQPSLSSLAPLQLRRQRRRSAFAAVLLYAALPVSVVLTAMGEPMPGLILLVVATAAGTITVVNS